MRVRYFHFGTVEPLQGRVSLESSNSQSVVQNAYFNLFANNTHSQPGAMQLALLNTCFDLLGNQATAKSVKRHRSQHRIIFEFGQI